MELLVIDSSIAFDLERGGLIEAAFKVNHALVTPDLLYANELEDGPGPYLRGLGMQVVELNAAEVSVAQALANKNKRVSTPDCWAMVTAQRENHRLLTGDAQLRALAGIHRVPCSGLLWLLEAVAATGVMTHTALIEGLTRTCLHTRCRLPRSAVESVLQRWRAEAERLSLVATKKP